MFHLLANNVSLNSAAFTAMAGVPDSEFSRQAGNAFVLSEDYKLLAAFARGATIADVRFNVPTINQFARHHIYSMNQSATVPSNPIVADYRDMPIALPEYEQLIVEATNSAGGAEQTDCFLFISPGTPNRNLPAGQQRLLLQATFTAGGTAATQWNGPASLTFAENIKSGWYAVVGAQCVRAGTSAFRLIFAKPFMHSGRKMRPGGLCTQTNGNFPWWPQMGGFGEWGRFHSQEPPQAEVFQTTGASVSHTLWLDCIYMGSAPP